MLMRRSHSSRSRCAGAVMFVWPRMSSCRPHLSLPNCGCSGLTGCLQDIMVGLECAEQRQSLQVTCCQHAPHPALVAVPFYCCMGLSLSERLLPSQEDLQGAPWQFELLPLSTGLTHAAPVLAAVCP